MLLRKGDYPQRWLFRCPDPERPGHPGRPELPELPVLGVAYDHNHYRGHDVDHPNGYAYKVREPSHRFFRGRLAYGNEIGKHGLTSTFGTSENGQACGWEMDHSEEQDNNPGFDGGASAILGSEGSLPDTSF
jgi:hypothetical protein